MRFVQAALSMYMATPEMWRADWAWGLPLILLTVVIHVVGLGFLNQRAVRVLDHTTQRRYPMAVFAEVMGTTTLLVTSLHALEAGIWATAYQFLGALPDYRAAMLYSLNAMTSYGHEGLFLAPHWQLMGAIESLNGWLLFGLTTAFLFGMIQRIWSVSSSVRATKVERLGHRSPLAPRPSNPTKGGTA